MVSCLQKQSDYSSQPVRSQHRRVDLVVGLEKAYQSFSNHQQRAWVKAEDEGTSTFSTAEAMMGQVNVVPQSALLAMQELLDVLDDRLEQVI